MKNKIFRFLIYSIIFSLGIFIGEWFLDSVTNTDRYPIIKEAKDAIFIGIFMSILLIFVNKFQE